MNKLSNNQKNVLCYLSAKKNTFVRSTEIGHVIGGYNRRGILRHSSWACPILKKLVEKKLVLRSAKGEYMITQLGINANKEIKEI